MIRKQLEEYCAKHSIWVPPKASKNYLEAAIARAVYHRGKSNKKNCFGYWAKEDSSCLVCDLSEACFEASMGMDMESYQKAFDAVENPRIRFTEGLRK